MRNLRSDVILPFLKAHHRYIQVLINRFTLRRKRTGLELLVEFGNKNLAVWSDLGKREVRKRIRNFGENAVACRRSLNNLLQNPRENLLRFKSSQFPFRYASGGTLPIVQRGHVEYYCFFYRDISPVGWNIANGGCDSLHELLHPVETIEREFREEVVAFNCRRREWLLFEAGDGEIAARPEFLNIRAIMDRQYPRLGLREFNITEIPLKWLDGPDRLLVSFDRRYLSNTCGCFLNINPEDFGIEIDRVAWITIDEDTILYDGESCGDSLINSPVGLFEVERFNELVRSGCNRFLPDLFFHDARRYEDGPKQIERKVAQYVKRMSGVRPYRSAREYANAAAKFDMCPATRGVVQRYLSTLTRKPKGQYDIFISFGSEDERLARRIYEYLIHSTGKRVFFSAETMHDGDYMRQLMLALESAQKLILVGTNLRHIVKPHVEFEWRAFHLLTITEPRKKSLVPVMVGVDPKTLPLPLRLCHGRFPKNEEQLAAVLPRLR
jgi:hypothetical protein